MQKQVPVIAFLTWVAHLCIERSLFQPSGSRDRQTQKDALSFFYSPLLCEAVLLFSGWRMARKHFAIRTPLVVMAHNCAPCVCVCERESG